MYAELHDGRKLQFPDGTDPAVIRRTVKRVLGVSDSSRIPGQTIRPAEPEQQDTMLQKFIGTAIETPAALASGMIGGTLGGVAGAVKGLFGGKKYGTQEGVRDAQAFGDNIAREFAYQPVTQTGQANVKAIGGALNNSGIVGVAPLAGEMAAITRAIQPATNALRDVAASGMSKGVDIAGTSLNKIQAMASKPAATMKGGGAASVDPGLLRAQRASDLPVPIRLTKGQRERTFEQQRFERETAKLPKEGEPIRALMDEQNAAVLENFDAFAHQTGANAYGLRAVGKVVDDALVKKVAEVKANIRAAYTKAKEAGQMEAPAPYSGLSEYLAKNDAAATTGNAPMLAAVKAKLGQLDPQGTGSISISGMEELRQMAGRLSTPGTPNMAYIGEVKRLIDASTEGLGGTLYRQARRMNENYANQFKNTSVINRLLSNKPGTKDRTIAFEDVFDHTILKGSLDDVRAVRRTLQTAGPDGVQAWKELQGQTINHIRETMGSNVARDAGGNVIVSPAKLDRLVMTLDADGKLDFLFGKKGGETIRSINDIAKDVYTSVPGSVNSSNTASVLIGLLDTVNSAYLGFPAPVGMALKFGVKRVKENALNKLVRQSLEQPNQLERVVQP